MKPKYPISRYIQWPLLTTGAAVNHDVSPCLEDSTKGQHLRKMTNPASESLSKSNGLFPQWKTVHCCRPILPPEARTLVQIALNGHVDVLLLGFSNKTKKNPPKP